MGAIAAALAITAVGAGVSAYGASQAGKGSGQSRKVSELKNLPYKQQLQQAQKYAMMQQMLNQQQVNSSIGNYSALVQAQQEGAKQAAATQLSYMPKFAAAEREATTAQRAGDLTDFSRNAPGWQNAFAGVSPAYAGLLSESSHVGPSALRNQLGAQALSDLQLGGQLSAQDTRGAEQQARSAYSARGLAFSNPAIGAELLNRDVFSRQRLAERQQAALQAGQFGMQEDQSNRGFLLNASQAQLNPILGMSQSRSAVTPNSVAQSLYGGLPSLNTYGQISESAPNINSIVNGSFQPLYNYSNNVYGENNVIAENRAQASAKGYQAIGGGLMSAGGGVAKGAGYG